MKPLLCLLGVLSLQAQDIHSDWQAALNRVRASSLQGHLSFLASDALEGRDTPSRGLDVAAEYIASQFRRSGLEPAGNNGFFHDSQRIVHQAPESFDIRIYHHGGSELIPAIPWSPNGASIVREPILQVNGSEPVTAREAVLVMRLASEEIDPQNLRKQAGAFTKRASEAAPKAVIVVDPSGSMARAVTGSRIARLDASVNLAGPPMFFVAAFPENLPADARITIESRAIEPRPFRLRNVAGILRGGDPELSKTYIVLSAHFDHVGKQAIGSGDVIYNGANDDASGTSALLEIAEALSHLPQRPRRSILFLAVSGEEKGLLGSRAFAESPSVPLSSIAANLNLEHLGRPDADGDSYLGKATVTGFDFSTMGERLAAAGKLLGYEIFKHPKFSDPFFTASDNFSFAEKGIPAHTLSNGFLFPEYHRQGDHWDKIHYGNLELLTRAIALGLLSIADDSREPQWNESNPKTDPFREAQRRLQAPK